MKASSSSSQHLYLSLKHAGEVVQCVGEDEVEGLERVVDVGGESEPGEDGLLWQGELQEPAGRRGQPVRPGHPQPPGS